MNESEIILVNEGFAEWEGVPALRIDAKTMHDFSREDLINHLNQWLSIVGYDYIKVEKFLNLRVYFCIKTFVTYNGYFLFGLRGSPLPYLRIIEAGFVNTDDDRFFRVVEAQSIEITKDGCRNRYRVGYRPPTIEI